MTTLKETLKQDITTALKAKDTLTLSILRYAISIVDTEEKKQAAGTEFSDEEVQTILKRIVRQMSDGFAELEKFGEVEALAQAQKEVAVLETYLPQALSEDEIRTIAQSVIAETGKDVHFGQVLRVVMPQTKNRADGAVVKRIVEEELEK